MSETIPLRDALAALRVELVGATGDAAGQKIRFELGPIELEFQVVATTEKGVEGKVGGKVNFHIFSAEASIGGNVKGSDDRTQKVKLVLNPVLLSEGGERRKLDIRRKRK